MTAGAPGARAAGTIVRPAATAADWAAVRELCCLTGENGEPVERARWPLFAELWIGPYQRLAPAWTYVAEADGRVVGYLTGCPDTRAFRRAGRLRVTLPLLLRIAGRRVPWTSDARRLVGRLVRRRRGLEARLPQPLRARLLRDYPAHLHMNVAAGRRGQGIGAALLARYVGDLARAGVPGVHLFCGAAPLRFYVREGFVELGALAAAADQRVHALGRRLGAG